MSRRPYRRLYCESLENRCVMAGNVLAEVAGGNNLTLSGDDLSNNIVIERISAAQIRLRTDPGQSDTTINGQMSIDLDCTAGGAWKLLMKGGHDHVQIGNNGTDVVVKSFQADFGAGMDDLNAYRLTVTGTGTTNIVMGGADQNEPDSVSLGGIPGSYAGNLVVRTGGGNDYVGLGTVNVGKNVWIDLGTGNDDVTYSVGTVGKNLTVKLGEGDNPNNLIEQLTIVGSLRVAGGNGADELGINNVFVAKAKIQLFGGHDDLTITVLAKAAGPVKMDRLAIDAGDGDDDLIFSLLFAADARIKLGSGDNSLATGFSALAKCRIEGGEGIDEVDLTHSTIDSLTGMFLGGDDTLTTLAGADVKFTKLLKLNGGTGTNTLTNDGISQLPADPTQTKITDFTIV